MDALNQSDQKWYDIFNDEQIQKMFTALAPFVKKDDLKLWQDDDLRYKRRLTVSERTDLPTAFVQLLHCIDALDYETNWQCKLYGSGGNSDVVSFVADGLQKHVRAGMNQVVGTLWGNPGSP